ncbi:hypothetical protein ACFLZV_02180 [Candidatus Margulisiibacteriota bacterium]
MKKLIASELPKIANKKPPDPNTFTAEKTHTGAYLPKQEHSAYNKKSTDNWRSPENHEEEIKYDDTVIVTENIPRFVPPKIKIDIKDPKSKIPVHPKTAIHLKAASKAWLEAKEFEKSMEIEYFE